MLWGVEQTRGKANPLESRRTTCAVGRWSPLQFTPHKAGNGRFPLPAATAIARSARLRPRADGWPTAKRAVARPVLSRRLYAAGQAARHRLPEQARAAPPTPSPGRMRLLDVKGARIIRRSGRTPKGMTATRRGLMLIHRRAIASGALRASATTPGAPCEPPQNCRVGRRTRPQART